MCLVNPESQYCGVSRASLLKWHWEHQGQVYRQIGKTGKCNYFIRQSNSFQAITEFTLPILIGLYLNAQPDREACPSD